MARIRVHRLRVYLENLRALALWLLGAYVLWWFLSAIEFVLILFAFGFLFAAVMDPPVRWLHDRGVSRGLATVGIILIALSILFAAVYYTLPPLANQTAALLKDIPTFAREFQDRLQMVARRYPFMKGSVRNLNLGTQTTSMMTQLLAHIGDYGMYLIEAITAGIVTLFLTIYVTADPDPIVRRFVFMLPRRRRRTALRMVVGIRDQLQGLVKATFLMMLTVGLMSGAGLWAMGVQSPVLFGVIAGLGELVPTLGPLITAVPPLIVTLAVHPVKALWVALLYIAIHQIENHILIPRIMASTLKLHPVSVIFSVLVLVAILGPVGALLATPACVVVKVVYEIVWKPSHV